MNCSNCSSFFDFRRLSISRSVLMGAAIIMIYILHSGEIGNSYYDTVSHFGWMGVDIFFFLSAFGQGFSLKKERTGFLRRRLWRILPTWIIVLFLVHVIGLLCLHFLPHLPFHVPQSFSQILTWYTGLGYFIANVFDFSDKTSWYYEWYIPTLLLFYILTPWLYRRSNKQLFLLFIFSLIVGQVIITNVNTYYLVLSITRIPIYLMGVLFFRYIDGPMCNPKNDRMIFIGLLMMFFLIVSIPDSLVVVEKEYRVLFVIPCCCIFISIITERLKYISVFLSFLGGISLELYLIHLYRRPHYLMSFIFDNQIVIILSTFLFCTIAAFILQRVVKVIIKKVNDVIIFEKRTWKQ